MKLSLAQFRELEAFAQFSSDLDSETKKQIDLGQRLVEILKQPQFAPMSVEHQTAVIFAVSNGCANEVAVKDIRVWEDSLHVFLGKFKKPLLDKISAGSWDDAIEKELKETMDEFKKK